MHKAKAGPSATLPPRSTEEVTEEPANQTRPKADDGLVEGNTIDGSTIAGIVLAPELWWGEACYSRNVVIRNNTVRHVGYSTAGPWTDQAGAITILGLGDPKSAGAGKLGHRHITIEGNTVADCDGVNLLIDSAEDVAVRHNRFVRPQAHATRRGADRGIHPAALVWLSNCRNVRFEANTIRDAGAAFGKPYVAAPSAKDLYGLPDGIARK